MGSKCDARKVERSTQTHLRRSVVQAVRGGMKQTQASQVFGVSLRAVNRRVVLDKAGGLRALKPKRRGRRAGEGRLDRTQSMRIRQMIIDGLPDQLKLPVFLWMLAAEAGLLTLDYGIKVSLGPVGR